MPLNNIPTAEEFFKKFQNEKGFWNDYDSDSVAADYIQIFAIEFAKLHVEQALKNVHHNLQLPNEDYGFIVDSYPLEKIK